MTDERRITRKDIEGSMATNAETQAAKILALGHLAVAQSIDGLTAQLKRVIDTEFDPEPKDA